MAQQPYKRPPITEAVIAISFGAAMDSGDLEKANSRFAKIYPQHQDTRNLNVELVMPTRPNLALDTDIRNDEVGHRRSSDDQTQIIILWPASFVFSQLGLYPGWDELFARFVRDWEIFKRVVGYRRISRVGVRYINRIDIPVTGNLTYYEDFLKIYPQFPEELDPIFAYSIQTQLPCPEIEGRITINSASIPSPLLDHASFMFDQDIYKDNDVPQNERDLYDLLSRIHLKKNAVFEACITDRARELFNS